MKIVIYSCVVGAYDELLEPEFIPQDCEFVRFTDSPTSTDSHWEFRPLASPAEILDPIMINRWHKFFPNRLFPDADFSIYIDGNIRVIGDLGQLVDMVKSSRSAIGFPPQGQRDTLLEEVEACRELGKFSSEDEARIEEQLDFYKAEAMPNDLPLSGNFLLVRWHQAKGLNTAMELWWDQFGRFTHRDQLSLPYVLWKTGLPFKFIPAHAFAENSWFKREHHKPMNRSFLQRLIAWIGRRLK